MSAVKVLPGPLLPPISHVSQEAGLWGQLLLVPSWDMSQSPPGHHALYLRLFERCWKGCEVVEEETPALTEGQGQGQGHGSTRQLCAGQRGP